MSTIIKALGGTCDSESKTKKKKLGSLASCFTS